MLTRSPAESPNYNVHYYVRYFVFHFYIYHLYENHDRYDIHDNDIKPDADDAGKHSKH